MEGGNSVLGAWEQTTLSKTVPCIPTNRCLCFYNIRVRRLPTRKKTPGGRNPGEELASPGMMGNAQLRTAPMIMCVQDVLANIVSVSAIIRLETVLHGKSNQASDPCSL